MSADNFVKVCAGEDTRAIDDIHVFILFKTLFILKLEYQNSQKHNLTLLNHFIAYSIVHLIKIITVVTTQKEKVLCF